MRLQAVARHVPDDDAPAQRPRSDLDVHELIAAALRPEFNLDVIVPAVGQPIIGAQPCQVSGCGRGTYMNHFCRPHNGRWVRAGRPAPQEWAAEADPSSLGNRPMRCCDVEGCRRGSASSGLCTRHDATYRAMGQPDRIAWLRLTHRVSIDAPDCPVPGCGLEVDSPVTPLCRQHANRWRRAGKPPVETFAVDCLVRSCELFDLRQLTPTMRREVQYGLQCRVDEGRIQTVPLRMRQLINLLAHLQVGSLGDRTVQQWRDELTQHPSIGFVNGPLSFIRFTLDSLEDLQHGVGWESEYPRDIWRLRRLGFPEGTLAHLRFDDINPAWLRALAKRWLRWRLSTGLSLTQAGKDLGGLRRFAEFLTTAGIQLPSPAELDRELIERYLAWLAITRPVAKGRGGEISSLNGFLRAVQQHRWADELPATATIYAEDYPRQPAPGARALSGYVMAQLEAEGNLARFKEPRFRLLTEILQRAALRVGDARRLQIDCLQRDEHGAAFLLYRNHKMRRMAYVPIDDKLAAAITVQQQVVRARWPDGPVLFPMPFRNPDGTRAISRSAYAVKLKQWLVDCDIRTESGAPARLTPHQFRHTYATDLLNNDTPQWIVKKLLDHDSDTMVAHYARLNQQTVRRHWEAAMKIGVSGREVGDGTAGPLADAVWLKNSLSRAKMALPNGYCTLPLQQTCEYANACLTCPMFLTTADFLPEHRRQLTETRQLLERAAQHGQERVIQMNRKVEANLLAIITTLETHQPQTACPCNGQACGCRTGGGDHAS